MVSKLIECVFSLKNLVRTGWMQRGVPPSIGESVADHSFEASVIAGILACELEKRGVRVDVLKPMCIALLHDLPECLTGDIPYYTRRVTAKSKHDAENRACKDLLEDYPGLLQLYREWVMQDTIEAKIAKVAEKLSTLLQAKEYVKLGFDRASQIAESMRSELSGMQKKDEEYKIIVETAIDIFRGYL